MAARMREGIRGVNVEKHCCSHSTGTAEAAMQTLTLFLVPGDAPPAAKG